MIEVYICINGEPIGQIEILNQTKVPTEYADYSVRFGIDRGSAVGVHSRTINAFPRKKYNVLGLLRLALDSLRESELELEPGYDVDSEEATVSADLARGLRDRVREISSGFSRLHHH